MGKHVRPLHKCKQTLCAWLETSIVQIPECQSFTQAFRQRTMHDRIKQPLASAEGRERAAHCLDELDKLQLQDALLGAQ